MHDILLFNEYYAYKHSNMIEQVSTRQKRLATVIRATSGTIRSEDVVRTLGLSRSDASKMLARWHNQGVIRRVSHGIYVPVEATALGRTQVLEDPWVLVPQLYTPGYVGGWSALEHWEFTEQLFRSVCVLTEKRISQDTVTHQGVQFFVKTISAQRNFGTKILWRDHIKVAISDPHKTILDIIDDPFLGAGLQHVMDCLAEYRKRQDKSGNINQLLEYALQQRNGSLFKKLGFLAEHAGFEKRFLEECKNHLTAGYTHLDKNTKNKKLVTRWRLWVPEGYEV